MKKCKLKKGDRIFECRNQKAILTELITDPQFFVQRDSSRFWHWEARIIETGEVAEYGIDEESPEYGPKLFRKNVYEVGYSDAEPILPPFDTSDEWIELKNESVTFFVDGNGIAQQFEPAEDRIKCIAWDKIRTAIKKVSLHITPEVEQQADEVLDC